MANNIALHQAYLKQLDEVYKRESLTAVLDTETIDSTMEAKKFTVDKMSLSDLADYSRETGYVQGDVTITQEEKEPNYDRGRKFQVDTMDDLETGYIAFGKLGAEFERTKVIPEVDAFRFGKYATAAGTKKTGTLDADTIIPAIDEAEATFIDNEVGDTNNILFINAAGYGYLKQKAANRFANVNEGSIDRTIETFDKMKVVVVPQGRFNTAVTLTAGGGYELSGSPINFLIVNKGAVMQFAKHKASNVISPEDNQSADAYILKYRHYGLADVWDNKVKGIYVHSAE
jgi:hypothetical protein